MGQGVDQRVFRRALSALLAGLFSCLVLVNLASAAIDDIRTNPSFGGVAGDFFEVDFGLGPEFGNTHFDTIFFVGVRKLRRVVTLDRQSADRPSGSIPELLADSAPRLLQVSDWSALNFGVGPNAADGRLPSLNPTMGVMPLRGSSSISRQYVTSAADVGRIRRLKPPKDANTLAAWPLGGELTWGTAGGVVFSAGLGYQGTVGVGGRYLILGEWQIQLKKFGEQEFHFAITNTRFRSLALSIGTAFAFVEDSAFRARDERFAFTVNLAAPGANEVLASLLNGDMTLAQERAEIPDSGIRSVDRGGDASRGRFRSWFFGIPEFIYAFNTHGSFVSERQIVSAGGAVPVRIQLGGYLEEAARGGVFLHNRSTRNDFFVAEFGGPEDKPNQHRYLGQYLWNFEQERGKPRNLRAALEQLTARTGLRSQLAVRVPELKPGYLHARLKLGITPEGIDKLMQLASARPALFEDVAARLASRYFDTAADPDGLCGRFVRQADEIAGTDLEGCRDFFDQEARQAGRKAAQALRESSSRGIESFVGFGKPFLSNQFIFGAVLALAGEENVKVDYSIEGERIFRWEAKPSIPRLPGIPEGITVD